MCKCSFQVPEETLYSCPVLCCGFDENRAKLFTTYAMSGRVLTERYIKLPMADWYIFWSTQLSSSGLQSFIPNVSSKFAMYAG